jgi:hypothetical protein
MANGELLNRIRDTGRAKEVSHITVAIDSSKFTKRKLNIFKQGLDKGYVVCGVDTGNLLDAFSHGYGFRVAALHKSRWYMNHIKLDMIQPEKIESLFSYLIACRKLDPQQNKWRVEQLEKSFDEYKRTESLQQVVPLEKSDTYKYIEEFLLAPTPQEEYNKQRFLDDLEEGRTINITYEP